MEIYLTNRGFASIHFFFFLLVFQNVLILGRILWDLWNFKPFHFSPPIFKLPINFHHQYSATGTDMAEMHWFILDGGMFTEIKPDSVKAKHMLQHENPTPSSKTSLVMSNFSSLGVSPTPPSIFLCHILFILSCAFALMAVILKG